jgi:hypothetical protein
VSAQEKSMRESYLTFETAGNIKTHMSVGVGIHRCGDIHDGVSIHNHNEGDWSPSYVMAFKDLEAWYLAAKATRDAVQSAVEHGADSNG